MAAQFTGSTLVFKQTRYLHENLQKNIGSFSSHCQNQNQFSFGIKNCENEEKLPIAQARITAEFIFAEMPSQQNETQQSFLTQLK